MRIVLVAVGRIRPPFLDDAQHYEKLLSRQCRFEMVEVAEDQQVERRLPARAYVALLDQGGRQYDSLAFSRWMEKRRQSGLDLCFVVGGAFGLELESADERLSLGEFTLPHQLARVVMMEQLFRAHKILAGESYHY
jgi:23S rRNA (pseudouridine1915-N3)-methyltransferase